MRPEGECGICGKVKPLTREHMPPRAAFNQDRVLLAKIDKERSRAGVKWKGIEKAGGHFEYVLCEDCNGKTGRWYGTEYVPFIKQAALYAVSEYLNKKITVNFRHIFPLRVAKEALAIICSSCGPGVTKQDTELRKLILGEKQRGLPSHLRLYAYLRGHKGGRSSGVAGILNTQRGTSRVVAEFSWWPIGWLLTFQDEAGLNECDVTNWFQYDCKDRHNLCLSLNCHYATTAYPLDFRSPEQVFKEAAEQKAQMRSLAL